MPADSREDLKTIFGRAGNFLGGATPTEADVDLPPSETLGTAIGPYKLLEQIGEGGFGDVYLAEQRLQREAEMLTGE